MWFFVVANIGLDGQLGTEGLQSCMPHQLDLPFSVLGVRPNCCALVEPSRTLTEEYGVIVGHTLVDTSSRTASVLMVYP